MKNVANSLWCFIGQPEFSWSSPRLKCTVNVNVVFVAGVLIGGILVGYLW